MPLLLAIPIITGLVGLFAGAQVENKINNPPAPVGSNDAKAPWYITPLLVIGAIVLVIVIARGLLKKSKIIS